MPVLPTRPSADALIAAGIRRVVIADSHNPDPRVSERGITKLRAAGIRVATGRLCAEAWPAHAELLPEFAPDASPRRLGTP